MAAMVKSEWCFTHPQLRGRRHRLLQRSLNKSPPIWVQRWKAISHQGMSSNAMAHSAVGCPAGREHWVGSRTRFCKSTIYKSMSSEYISIIHTLNMAISHSCNGGAVGVLGQEVRKLHSLGLLRRGAPLHCRLCLSRS